MDNLIADVLARLGWTSVQSVLLVALVWAVCRVLPALPATTRCRLWWLVAAQAVLGLVWSSPLELAVLPAPAAYAVHPLALPVGQGALTMAPAALDAASFAAPPSTLWSWPALLLAAWAAGVLLMLLHTLCQYRHSRALVRSAVDCTDATLLQALQLAAEAHGLRHAPRLKMSAQIHSPQLIGPWHPVLLLPARELPAMSADALDMALTHELVHLQRRDLWWGLLPALAQHLFFFHPLVHLAGREYALAREEACDGAVVAGHGHCRQDYGRLLLQLGVAPRPVLGVASASPNFRSLKRRLLTLQQTRHVPRAAALAITAVFVLVGVAPLRLVAAVPPPPPVPRAPLPPSPPAPPRAPAMRPAPAAPAGAAEVAEAAEAAEAADTAEPAEPDAHEEHQEHEEHADSDNGMVTHGRLDLSRQPAQAFVLMGDGDNFVDASLADLKQARRDAGDGDPALWVRRGQQRYLIRDRAVLQQLSQAYAEVGALGTRQGQIGERQGALGERIAAMSVDVTADVMASVDVAEIANRAAQQARQDSRRALDQREIARIARQQAELGKEQARLARQQAVASARAARAVRVAIDQALSSGRAQRLGD